MDVDEEECDDMIRPFVNADSDHEDEGDEEM